MQRAENPVSEPTIRAVRGSRGDRVIPLGGPLRRRLIPLCGALRRRPIAQRGARDAVRSRYAVRCGAD